MLRKSILLVTLLVASAIYICPYALPKGIRTMYDNGPLYMKDNNVGSLDIDCEIWLHKSGFGKYDRWAYQAADVLIDYYPLSKLSTTFSDLVALMYGKPGVTKEIIKVVLAEKLKGIFRKCIKGQHGKIEELIVVRIPSWEYSTF